MTVTVALGANNYPVFAPVLPGRIMDEASEDENVYLRGIVCDGFPVGTVAYRVEDRNAELIWYYVDPKYRGVGIGRDALLSLCLFLHDQSGIETIEAVIPAGSDIGLTRLFSGFSAGFEELPECRYETILGEFLRAGRLQGSPKKSVSLKMVSGGCIRMICNRIIEAGADLVDMPIKPEDYYAEASAVYFCSDDPQALLLVKRSDEGISIPYMVSFTNDARAIIDMLCFARKKLEKLDPSVPFYMNLVDDRLIGAVRIIAGLAKGDDTGFTHNKKATISLNFIEENRESVRDYLDLYRELQQEGPEVDLSKYL